LTKKLASSQKKDYNRPRVCPLFLQFDSMNSIINVRIKNFFSITNEVNIDFKASNYNIENNRNRLFDINGKYYNKVISLYGANASGKTTFLKSIVVLSAVINNESTENFPTSFKNKFAHLNSKSEIDIGFILEIYNEPKEFLYQLKFQSENHQNIGIENEELYVVKGEKKEILFNRKSQQVKNVESLISQAIFGNLSDKKSLFQEFGKFEKTGWLKKITKFFRNLSKASNIISPYETRLAPSPIDESQIGIRLDDNEIKEALENFLLSFLNSVGLDIDKLKAKFEEENEKGRKFLGIQVSHKIQKTISLEFGLESDGTLMLIKILLDIFLVKVNKAILIIDEFDSIIHPMLIPVIINLLIENGIQIIYSTHNIYNMKFLQTDEIFLIEKDKDHHTKIQAVRDIENIKGYENLLSLYENGYLGGVPKVEEIITEIV
jgi:AAA15 family ATPase/GTPase